MEEALKIGFVPASRTIFDQELAMKVRGGMIEAIRSAGMEPVAPSQDLTKNGLVQTPEEAEKVGRLFRESEVSGVVVGALNFGNEIPTAIAATGSGSGVPILLFGIGEEGELTREAGRRDSFCGLISIATCLRHRGARYAFPLRAVGYPQDGELVLALEQFAEICRAVGGLRGAAYAQIGPRPSDFETCAYDELSLLRKFGTRIVPIPLSTLFARTQWVEEPAVRGIYAEMEGSVDRSAVSDIDLSKMARLEAALTEIVEEEGVSGIGLQCWTSMQEDYGVSPCFVMARLTERGIPCACEADMHGTLSMHLLSLVSGSPAVLADWNNRHYRMENVFSAWHCGVFPPSVGAGGARLGVHNILADSTGTEDGKYGTLELQMRTGPVTMARVTEHPDGRWPLIIVEGEVVDAPGEPFGSNAWVEVRDLDLLYSELLRGFPHHTALSRGHTGSSLAVAAYFLGLDTVVPLPIDGGNLEVGPLQGGC